VIVADTNLVAYLLIEGDRTDLARRVRAVDGEWVLPTLWRSEFLNVLATAVRAQVLDRSSASRAWQLALGTFSGAEHEPAGEAVLTVAIDKRLTAYDAQFVVTAIDLGVPLVTADRRILSAAPELAVSPTRFVEL
jgi:predicted nucleic acid-binding protein